MRYIFHADASPKIGAGHVMRTSAIAEEFIRKRYESIFIGEILEIPWLFQKISKLGFSEIIQNKSRFQSNSKTDVLVLDSYVTSPGDEFISKSKWFKVVSIFDAVTPSYLCDMRIHPGLSMNWGVIPNLITLSGPKFIPIRSSLRVLKSSSESSPIKILIVGGGTDINKFGFFLSKTLNSLNLEFEATVIAKDESIFLLDKRFQVVSFGIDFDNFVNNFDLVFTTASTTSLEMVSKHFAVGVGCSVENQEEYFSNLIDMNLALPIGIFKNEEWYFNIEVINKLIQSKKLRNSLKFNVSRKLDFNGSLRIMDEILKLSADNFNT